MKFALTFAMLLLAVPQAKATPYSCYYITYYHGEASSSYRPIVANSLKEAEQKNYEACRQMDVSCQAGSCYETQAPEHGTPAPQPPASATSCSGTCYMSCTVVIDTADFSSNGPSSSDRARNYADYCQTLGGHVAWGSPVKCWQQQESSWSLTSIAENLYKARQKVAQDCLEQADLKCERGPSMNHISDVTCR